ncbi:MAG: adenosine deaminase [Candidatus Bathyarchaeota archaeon]|nr:adenosine deaminase [Candidatus Bathyarchaeota archaeon]
MSVEETIKKLPKIEQHVHIVGSVRPETLLWLNKQGGLKLPYETLDDLKDFYAYTDFEHFLKVYSMVNGLITHEKYYETITYEMLQNQHNCNVKHVECIFSAYDHMHRGLDFADMVKYINRGITRARTEFGITCNIRVDVVRDYGPKIALMLLDQIKSKGDNVVSIDTGGMEDGIRPKTYEKVYQTAREQGLHLVAHQGEAAGVDYVWECVEYLRPERIGHGVAAAQDLKLLTELSHRGIGIETCPMSNLRTGAVQSLGEHPIRCFMEAGVKVSVNTDDPPMFATDMNTEYLMLHRELGFTVEELHNIGLDSIETSFIDETEKERLRKQFDSEYIKLV